MRFELYKSLFRRQWRWRMKAGNNKIVATSGEGYNNRQDCLYAISLVINLAPSAPTYENGAMLSMLDDPLVNPPVPSPQMQALVDELNAHDMLRHRGQLRPVRPEDTAQCPEDQWRKEIGREDLSGYTGKPFTE